MKRIIRLLTVLAFLSILALPAWVLAQAPEDGLYSIGVTSSSKMFRVTGCLLEVADGQMTARLTLSSDSYGYLYQGTPEQADTAPRDSWIAPEDSAQDVYTFRVPIPALDEPVEVAAWSRKYEKWYDRQLTFLSGSLRPEEKTPEKAAVPVPPDGRYSVTAITDSPLLEVENCLLAVEGGRMRAELTIAGSRYVYLYPGLARDALRADMGERIPLLPDDQGMAHAVVPVAALDEALPLATWSDKKSLWYDRTLTLDAASLTPVAAEGAPSFAFSGGSGRTTIRLLSLDEAAGLATIAFSSSHYTQVKVHDVTYLNESQAGDATFTLPLRVNGHTDISAETVAMSKPRWINYTLYLYTDGTDAAQLAQAGGKQPDAAPPQGSLQRPDIPGLTYLGDMPLAYAHNMTIRLYEEGWRLIQTANGRDYLVVPDGQNPPDSLPEGIIILKQPLDSVYLVATAAMCLVDAIGALPSLRFTGTRADGWYVPAAKLAMEAGALLYAGKYSAPDYELLLADGCDLTVQSTMVLQAPEVQEKFRELGIPMFIDMAGLESHPLGRTEWVKAYGVLLGSEEAAAGVFASQWNIMDSIAISGGRRPSVAYFYVNANGAVVSKPAAGYIPALIDLAGGAYLGPQSRTSDTASVAMDMEAFYALAKEADYLLYNAAIDAPPQSLSDLLAKNALFADFKAVREGRVYTASGALYQSAHRFGDAVRELHSVLTTDEAVPADSFFQKIP